MSYKKVTLCIGLWLAIFGCNSMVLAAGGPWSVWRQLPQKDSGVRLEQPVAVAIDAAVERYYVVDAATGQLVSFDKDGKFLSAFTAGDQLQHPVAMVKTAAGSLWVVERSSNELFYVNPREKKIQRFSPKYPDGTAIFLSKLALDEQSRLYVLDRMNGQIVRLDDNLQVAQVFAESVESSGFVDFKIRDSALWALDGLNARVVKFTLSGVQEKLIKIGGLQFPVALEVDRVGQLYLLDRHAGTVVVYTVEGGQTLSFLGKGKRAGQVWNGTDLMFDWEERLCVVDEGNGRVEVLTR